MAKDQYTQTFNDYEDLICFGCNKKFIGRKAAENFKQYLCASCKKKEMLPLVKEGDLVPKEAYDELTEGGLSE